MRTSTDGRPAKFPDRDTYCVVISEAINGLIGVYRGYLQRDLGYGPASGLLSNDNFGGTSGNSVSPCIVINAAQTITRRGAPLQELAPVIGRVCGVNRVASDGSRGSGTSADSGLLLVAVDAYVDPWFDIALSPGFVSGSNGNQTTQCTLTYGFTDPAGITQTNITPQWNTRPTVGYVTTADRGRLHYDWTLTTPAWVLYDVNEVADQEACAK